MISFRVAEEVQQTPPPPLDGSRTFTLPEFRSRLASTNQELLRSLERFSRRRAALLNAVTDVSNVEDRSHESVCSLLS